MNTDASSTLGWVETGDGGIGVESASATGAEVGVGVTSAGGGVAVAAVPQAMINTANRVRGTVKTGLNVRMMSAAILCQVFDPLQVLHHVAAVMFTAAR